MKPPVDWGLDIRSLVYQGTLHLYNIVSIYFARLVKLCISPYISNSLFVIRSTVTPGGSRPGSRTGSKPASRHGSNLSLDSTGKYLLSSYFNSVAVTFHYKM